MIVEQRALRTKLEELGDREGIITRLRAELREKSDQHGQTVDNLLTDLQTKVDERDRRISQLQSELQKIHHSKTWRLLQAYLSLRRKLGRI